MTRFSAGMTFRTSPFLPLSRPVSITTWSPFLIFNLAIYRTSGARDTIFMCFFALSSRVTGPKIRVPTGSPC